MILASGIQIELWDVCAGLSDETVETDKDPSCSKALSAEHRSKFAAMSPVMAKAAR
jgi:hypothetical protein